MDSASALRVAKKVLTADLACNEGDFDKEGIFFSVARRLEGARRFPLRNNSLNIATFGKGVVVSCSSSRLNWVKNNLGSRNRDNIFDPSAILLME